MPTESKRLRMSLQENKPQGHQQNCFKGLHDCIEIMKLSDIVYYLFWQTGVIILETTSSFLKREFFENLLLCICYSHLLKRKVFITCFLVWLFKQRKLYSKRNVMKFNIEESNRFKTIHCFCLIFLFFSALNIHVPIQKCYLFITFIFCLLSDFWKTMRAYLYPGNNLIKLVIPHIVLQRLRLFTSNFRCSEKGIGQLRIIT